ncbi:caspase family protein [Nodosilinea nodulosa]|uniref:nSTAND1 domain-containing NTPase n=1 Tax=Nodosilinea nodulosa TaxID=416001 RepID=UPI0003116C17|nr:caspase family protein [Nodosilinea nodulosa]
MKSADFTLNLAIIIGINNYQDGIPALGTARQDAEAIAKTLEQDHHYQVHLITDSDATRENIKRWLETDLPAAMQGVDSSRLIFYFAGHGVALNGDDGPAGYLIPQNGRLGDVNTYLPMTRVYEALIQLPCRHFLGVLDCCFAGAFCWSSTRKLVPIELSTIHKERFDRFIHDPAWQIITSAAHDQTASDAFDLKDDRGQTGHHSPFAAALIDALQGKADAYPPADLDRPAGDGVMTATELYMYLRDRVEVATEARSIRQTPGIYPLKKHDKGEYIFLTPGNPLNLPLAPPLDVSSNPYRGLSSFNEDDKDLFFGRTVLTGQLAEFVKAHALTVVLGASGSGKSSLVKAGLLPKLRRDQSWYLLPPFRPGESPFKALNKTLAAVFQPVSPTASDEGADPAAAPSESAVALPTPTQGLADWFEEYPQSHLLVVVDQFEELITLCRDSRERQQFLDLAAEVINRYPDRLHLVLTLRSDFEPQFRTTALEPIWQAARFIVPPMSREELQEAIEAPASARVMYFAPHELVDQLIDEVANMPGALPLLSFVLSELYLNYLRRQDKAREQGETLDRAITQSDYEELGGVTRSLTQRAEKEYNALVQEDPAYEYTIRNVMVRMLSVEGELTRRRVPLTELTYPEPENGRIQTVIERFEAARLLTSGTDIEGQPYQEPAHDALVQGWTRLLAWKQQHLGVLLLQRELTSDVEKWQSSSQKKQDFGLLWHEDPRLPTALQLSCGKVFTETWRDLFQWWFGYRRWQAQPHDYWLNRLEVDFLWHSFDQKFKRFGKSVSTITGVFMVLTGITGFAWQRASIADLRAEAAKVLNWLPTTNAAEALVLAIDTTHRSRLFSSLEMTTQSSLLSAVQVAQEVNRLQGHGDAVYAVAFSPDGQQIVSGSADKTIQLWNAQTGEPIGEPLRGHGDEIYALAFSPDGQRIVSGSADKTLQLWNAQTGEPIGEPLQGHGDAVRSVAFSSDGQRIVSGSADKTLRLWNAQTGEPIGEPLRGHGAAVWSVAFSPDGQRIVSGSADKTIRLWNAQTGEPIGEPLRGHEADVSAVAFSPNGQQIVSGSGDTTVRLWNAQTGEPIGQPMQGHEVVVSTVAFSPDGQRIVSGSWDKTVMLWDVQTEKPIGQPLRGHGAPVTAVMFSPNGERIVSSSVDKTVRLWEAQTGQPIHQLLPGHRAAVNAVAFSPATATTVNGLDQRIVSASDDGVIQIWNAQTGQPIGQPIQGHDAPIRAVAFSPDGQRIVSGSDDKTLRLWDAQTGEAIGQPLQGHGAAVNAVAFSPNGQRIVSGSDDQTLRLWDAQTGQAIGQPLRGHRASVNAVAFSPDGLRIVSGSADRTVQLWNAQTGQPVGEPWQGHGAPVNAVAFSPASRLFSQRIVSGSDDRTVSIWDAETGHLIGQVIDHGAPVRSVAFSPDGLRIVSGGDDWAMRLWDTQASQPIGRPLQGSRGKVNAVAFSPDGDRIVSGSADNMVRLWDASPHTWFASGCNRLQHHPLLTQPETVITDPDFLKAAHRAKAACQRRVWQP